MGKSRVLSLRWSGFVELLVLAIDQAIDAIDEFTNPIDEKLHSRGAEEVAAGKH